MNKLLIALTLLVAMVAVTARADERGAATLHACENEDGYPPFTFAGPDHQPHGYSIDLLTEALARSGRHLQVTFLPTKRCAASLDSGVDDLMTEDSWSPDYAERWLPSDVIWIGLDVFFYDKTRHPAGLSSEEVIRHPESNHGCGILGDPYGGFAPGQIDDRSYRFANAFDRLFHGECVFFPEIYEFGASFAYRGHPLLSDPRLGYVVQRLPDPAAQDPLYIYVRKDLPGAADLLSQVNETIISWRNTGRDKTIMAKYLDLKLLAAAHEQAAK